MVGTEIKCVFPFPTHFLQRTPRDANFSQSLLSFKARVVGQVLLLSKRTLKVKFPKGVEMDNQQSFEELLKDPLINILVEQRAKQRKLRQDLKRVS